VSTKDHFIFYYPKDIVSGDFYLLKKIKDYSLLAVVDCTGHGVPGAFMSMLGIAILNEVWRRTEINHPNHALNAIRDELKSCLQQKKGQEQELEAYDGMEMALVAINYNNNEMQFAGAFNPLYMIRDKKLTVFQADKMQIGIHHTIERSFTNHTIQTQKGDTFYLFTDGYIDQLGGLENNRFTSRRFKELLLKINSKSMSEQKLILNKTIEEWMLNETQLDDMTIIGFKIP